MPELPEVETIVRGLSRRIVRQKIKGIEIFAKRSFLWNSKVIKPSVVTGRTIKHISRRGKGIIMDLDKGYSLLIHLKMTGQLIYIPKGKKDRLNYGHPDKNFTETMPSNHTRVWFKLSKGDLYFNDQRRFGWVKLTPTKDVGSDKFFASLGIELFDKAFTPAYLYSILQHHPKSNIKSIISNQSLMTGLGNIYSDEALFYARLLPTRLGKSITKSEATKLHSAIRKVLEKGIKYFGTSINTHRTPEGSLGQMQKYLAVYDRTGQPCRSTCKGKVKKIRLNGRGTHFCPLCQH